MAKAEGPPTPAELRPPRPRKPLCIVGIGASAGGLDAVGALLAELPAETGFAYVVVVHLSADDPGPIAQILGRTTVLPVREIEHGVAVEPDHVYVMPRSAAVTYADGRLQLSAGRTPYTPIDTFLRSLALARGSRAIAVILAGVESDGAVGVRAVKAGGGITFAQEVRSAKLDAMPLAAVGTGAVDFMFPPAQIAIELMSLADRYRAVRRAATPSDVDAEADQQRVFEILLAAREVDFSLYRRTTIQRRILRRMVVNKVATLRDYVALLEQRPVEVEALYQDILIKVTHFFRDPETFDVLQRTVFPALIKARARDAPLRIWVPGCSTGEEVYSIAIAFLEVIEGHDAEAPFQIFATDISEPALEIARSGTYVENIAMDVSQDRLRRFFVKAGATYQISKTIRDACIFARHNLTYDPPFSRVDFVSCRNVLIYLEPSLQKRVIPLFHYAIKPSGYLVLGTSEALRGPDDLFTVVDKKNRIYARTGSPSRLSFEVGREARESARASDRPAPAHSERTTTMLEAQREADRVVMDRYAPPGVVIDSTLQIVQFRGHTGPYLEPAPGEASLDVLKMAREGLVLELRAAIHKAKRRDAAVRVEGIRLRSDGRGRDVGIEVIPLDAGQRSAAAAKETRVRALRSDAAAGAVRAPVRREAADRWWLVLFEESEPGRAGSAAEASRTGGRRARALEDGRVAKLENELAATREYLQVTIDEQDATNEELEATNEELLSSNEELQSINEELEMAKEELQSTNEELTTLNEELARRNAELKRLNNDLGNLLASVSIPIVMLSSDLRIRRFTPQAARVMNLIPTDIGRPIGDIKPRFEAPDLEELLAEVIDTVTIREREVQDREGHWFSMRIRPYRTSENKIDGAVLLLVDVDRLKRGSPSEAGTSDEG